ncbi:hypothetical protein INS49_004867 [Diaporthe citri]|uniref:uncharacterized protein n=1 Tax=Diaporthe citri TaxID=83186 RepID=UPI001C81970D|nr:uncharacterized protein INS49_004867 [Diaporthe citri]KAG6354262.1 hypothetical protein INS49_004867 [Diaporthe citri]
MAQQSPEATRKTALGGEIGMTAIWDEAIDGFKDICGESLLRGDVKSFDDVQKKIESVSKVAGGFDPEQEEKWDKAKRVGLDSLKYLKMLVGVASKASSLGFVPAGAADITSNALCFVFDIPLAIKGYHDAINDVFGKVSTSLSQFRIYDSMESIDASLDGLLLQEIRTVMVSFVKLCAHVVKYRQGSRWKRLRQDFKSIFDDDSGLNGEMTKFKDALQRKHEIEGTITLAQVVDTRKDMVQILEQFIVFNKTFEETQKRLQSFKDDTDRKKALERIRDSLSVPSTVRLDTKSTQTCTNIFAKCFNGTGSWITEHKSYKCWTESKDQKETSHVLIVSGPPSSGKSSVSAIITKRLEESKDRTYVAHYFFPASAKRSEDERDSVRYVLKYMAFQIARVDDSVRKALSKACDEGSVTLRGTASLERLWTDLKIGATGSGATYYLVFDGLENLPDRQAEMLVNLIFSSKLAGQPMRRVRVLLSGMDKSLSGPSMGNALRVRMEQYNGPDMRIIINEQLSIRGLLQHAEPGSDREMAREKVLDKLPKSVGGSYSLLKFGMDNVIRILSTRTAIKDLDKMLTGSINSHEVAINQLQRSLTGQEISDLNELLKWVLFSKTALTLDQLESAMYLSSGIKSPLASLEYIITNKYSAVLKIDGDCVYGQDNVEGYVRRKAPDSGRSSRPTISMSIKINDVDQEMCGHFFWDLAQQAIRHNFKFDFDAASNTSHNTIDVDEFEAHHTIVTRALDYLTDEPTGQTKVIGPFLVFWLPYHLDRLRHLEDEEKGSLMPGQRLEIGRSLYNLFKDEQVFTRHMESFKTTYWTEEKIRQVKTWLMDSAVQLRRLAPKWLDEVQEANPDTKNLSDNTTDGDASSSSSSVSSSAEIDWGEPSIPSDKPSDKGAPAGCYRGIGETYFCLDKIPDAIAQVEMALDKADQDGATPKPDKHDFADLHLRLGEYSYKAEDTQKAAHHYQEACMSDDEGQVMKGQLGHVKAVLDLPDPEVKVTLFQSLLTHEDGKGSMVNVLKMIARDGDRDHIMSKIFAVPRGHRDLFKGIVRALETATANAELGAYRASEPLSDARFAEDESRGVLLYYRAIAAYKHEVSPGDIEPVGAAVKLWLECRDQLSGVGGSNASVVRQDATRELAKHYFHNMVDGEHRDDIGTLSELAGVDSKITITDPSSYLAALYALRRDHVQSRAILGPRIKFALWILSDEVPENDRLGFQIISSTLPQYGDLKNAAVAVSLSGQPDLVTEALCFEPHDIAEVEGTEKDRGMDILTKLSRETVKAAQAQVPDASQQLRRLEAAKLHIESVLDDIQTKVNAEDPKTVRIPNEVRALESDEKILEILYAEEGEGQETTVEEWKAALAKEWDIRD